jgi:hypothetical protein
MVPMTTTRCSITEIPAHQADGGTARYCIAVDGMAVAQTYGNGVTQCMTYRSARGAVIGLALAHRELPQAVIVDRRPT